MGLAIDVLLGLSGVTRAVVGTGLGYDPGDGSGVFPPDGLDVSPLEPSGFEAMASIIPVVVVLGIVVAIVLGIRNAGVYLRRGIDPTTVDAEMKARLLQSPMLTGGEALGWAGAPATGPAPARRTAEERLAEIDRLRSAGAITEDEQALARAEVLREL